MKVRNYTPTSFSLKPEIIVLIDKISKADQRNYTSVVSKAVVEYGKTLGIKIEINQEVLA